MLDGKKERQSITGNLTDDPKISEHTSKDGRDFKVASFSVATNDKDGNVKFTNCYAYDNKIEKVENLKKGDFVSLLGKIQVSQSKEGKSYENFKVYGVKALKENKKESVLNNVKKFKEKTKTKSKNNISKKAKENEI